MKSSTLRKWRRDALETLHIYKHGTSPNSILIRRLANQVLILVDTYEVAQEES